MLQQVLASAGLDPQNSARLLGISPRIFGEWVAGQRPIPDSVAHQLSAVLGVQPSTLLASAKRVKTNQADITPAIWYKLRGEQLVDADRECVLLIRQLAYFVNELEEVTQRRAVGWQPLFEGIRRKTDIQAPPREQGRQAARMFRESRDLVRGNIGIGEVFRGNLRAMGLLVIESPLPESKLEGCSFFVGSTRPDHQLDRPCIFANTHHGTWFRRNSVLMHEVGHAIFDAESAAASLDFVDTGVADDLTEQRAQAFAQEVLVPQEVLRHIAQARGIRCDRMGPRDLAMLVAETHVEQRTVIAAAVEADFAPLEQAEQYLAMDLSSELRNLTDHALTTKEYIRKIGMDAAAPWIHKRTTTIPSRPLRLPPHYVKWVQDAFNDAKINRGKAAELLMIDEDTFDERFGKLVNSE